MSLENQSPAPEKTFTSSFPAHVRRLQSSVKASLFLTVFLGGAGCASDFQTSVAPCEERSSVLPLPIADPALVTMEEVAAIFSDEVPPSKLQRLMDQIEIADGNLRLLRISIARGTSRTPQDPQTIKSLNDEKKKWEKAAQQITLEFLQETTFEISYNQLRYPPSFDMQSMFDAEEELHHDPGRLNAYITDQMENEESKLHHLRLMIAFCRFDQHLNDDDRSFHLQQLTVSTRMTEDGLQFLQNLFHKRM